jgi:hypothetical protein
MSKSNKPVNCFSFFFLATLRRGGGFKSQSSSLSLPGSQSLSGCFLFLFSGFAAFGGVLFLFFFLRSGMGAWGTAVELDI